MEQIVIGLSGMPGAGKTTVAKELEAHYGFSLFGASSVIRGVLAGRGIHDPVREQLAIVGRELEGGGGGAVFAKFMIDHVQSNPGSHVVLDAIRFLDMNALIAQTIPGYVHVHITNDPITRHRRTLLRGEKPGEDTLSFNEFLAQDGLPGERESRLLLDHADMIVSNCGHMALLNTLVRAMLAQIHIRRTAS